MCIREIRMIWKVSILMLRSISRYHSFSFNVVFVVRHMRMENTGICFSYLTYRLFYYGITVCRCNQCYFLQIDYNCYKNFHVFFLNTSVVQNLRLHWHKYVWRKKCINTTELIVCKIIKSNWVSDICSVDVLLTKIGQRFILLPYLILFNLTYIL